MSPLMFTVLLILNFFCIVGFVYVGFLINRIRQNIVKEQIQTIGSNVIDFAEYKRKNHLRNAGK